MTPSDPLGRRGLKLLFRPPTSRELQSRRPSVSVGILFPLFDYSSSIASKQAMFLLWYYWWSYVHHRSTTNQLMCIMHNICIYQTHCSFTFTLLVGKLYWLTLPLTLECMSWQNERIPLLHHWLCANRNPKHKYILKNFHLLLFYCYLLLYITHLDRLCPSDALYFQSSYRFGYDTATATRVRSHNISYV